MITQFDEKGKIYTNVIQKVPLPVIIQTQSHRINGEIYIRPDERLMDELNKSNEFLAVTNAVVLDAQGGALYQANFLTLNRDQIIWLIPVQDLATSEKPAEEGEA
ncbi:MAG: hypothetical protein ABFD44_13600 [Anaerolineaceae bacterium]